MELDNHDLATLPDLNEEIILDYLKIRYENDIIYTYIGDILLAINPFKQLPIYDQKTHRLYNNSNRKIAPPHVYALADFAYEALKNNSYKSQCCVISGESGAGKTESTKHFIKHLIYLCLGNTRLELQILQVNPLLEAFGNAKTLMNDNSSRFGKYIELMFVNNKVVGGKISEYLLEKSRVAFQNIGEQNFHIFYYLMAGLEGQSKQFWLKSNENTDEFIRFNYLNNYSINTDYDYKRELMEKYDELINAMNYVAFMESEQIELFSALIGILHVGNLKFKSNDEGYAIFINSSKDAKQTLMAISSLLGINTSALIDALTTALPTAGGRDEFTRNYTLEAALDARDALAKHVYSKLFTWIVGKINQTLQYESPSAVHVKEIGILDIYGFEHFQKNGFEQLCINLANEQIQYFFNKHIFTLEKEEYHREGIHSIEITFNDNQPLLDLFMGTSGILKKLDDLCKLPRTTDISLIENFNKEFSKNCYYVPSKRQDSNFTINHYAGRVTYTSENFLEKNRDSLPFRVAELLRNSSNDILAEIFSSTTMTTTTTTTIIAGSSSSSSSNSSTASNCSSSSSNGIGSGKDTVSMMVGYGVACTTNTMRNLDKSSTRLSVSAQYRNSLEVLMKRMSESRPIFLRCIKPNSSKRPDDFNEKFVLLQLRYCGVLETTRIRKEGFSLRPTFQEFVERYKYLAPDNNVSVDSYTCTKILKNSNLKNWRVGRTKVFLKYYHYEQLKLILDRYIYYATCIQKYVRRWIAKRELRKRLEKANKEQNKIAEFCGYLHLKSVNVFQSIQKSSQIKLPKTKALERDVVVGNNLNGDYKKLNIDRESDRYSPSNLSDSSYGTKIYDNLNNRNNSNSTVKNSTKLIVETKKRDPCWLYGKITRGQAEEFLKNKEVGTFLIRKSDSRDGYSLSFKAENRCRHYMIDSLPNGKFIIIGEPRVHNTLKDLVEYHRKHKLSNWNGYLSHPFMAD